MFCSTIIPTIGRPSLDRAVESVLSQQFVDEADFEIIVVNDSGKTLPSAKWQNSGCVSIIETNQHERSFARNVGASIAKGEYLHFLDDDDWLAPNALQSFWKLASKSDAGWLYGTSQLVDRQHMPLIQLTHKLSGNAFLQTMAGEWIPLQASLIRSDIFFKVGGFDPLLIGPEDIDLLRRITLNSHIVETSVLVAYIVRGKKGSTTNYDTHSLGSRQAREKILESPEAFTRLRNTAETDFWRGRFSRIYLTSTIWNLQNKRLSTALSRALSSMRTMLFAQSSLFSASYWAALTKPFRSETFARGIENAQGDPSSIPSQDRQGIGGTENRSWKY